MPRSDIRDDRRGGTVVESEVKVAGPERGSAVMLIARAVLILRYAVIHAMCGLCVAACATTSGSRESNSIPVYGSIGQNSQLAELPPYTGPRRRVHVVRFGIPADIAAKYPELAQKRIGWGLGNRIVDTLFETGVFELIEEKEEILRKLIETWELSQAGVYAEQTPIITGELKAPEFLVYGEVFDFGVSVHERVVALGGRAVSKTRIGVQVRIVDVETGQYVPGSGFGEYMSGQDAPLWPATREEFDQTTVGRASQLAVETAVVQGMRRLAGRLKGF